MRSKLRTRIGSALLTATMLLSLLPTGALAATTTFTDIQNHWGKNAIERWSSYGIVSGIGDGIFAPDADITRAEMAQIYVNLLHLTEKADISNFTDIPAGAWYADAVAKCVAAGIFSGTSMTTFSPAAPITREQIFVTFGHAIGLQPLETTDSSLSDLDQVSDWAQGMVNAILEAGYASGVGNNMLMPLIPINRASVMAMMDTAVAGYANESGATVETEDDGGLVLIVADNVTVTGTVGDVVVAQGAAKGSVTLKDATVTGTVTLAASDAKVNVTGDTKVENLVVSAEAKNSEIAVDKGASVAAVTAAAEGTTVSGDGTVTKVEAAEGSSNVKVTTPGTEVENNSSDTVTTDKGEVKPGQSGTTTKPSTGGGSSSGGSSSVVTTASVSNLEQLNAALANPNITTITLRSDLTLESTVAIMRGVRFVLNGNSITYTGASGYAFTIATTESVLFDGTTTGSALVYAPVTPAVDSGLIQVSANANLTLDGVSCSGNVYYDENNRFEALVMVENSAGGASLTFNNVTSTSNHLFLSTDTGDTDTLTLVVNGGNYTATGNDMDTAGCGSVFVIGPDAGRGGATFTNVTASSENGYLIQVYGIDATFTNCNFTTTGVSRGGSPNSAVAVAGGGSATIDVGTYTSAHYGLYVYNSGGTITVNSGTVSGTVDVIRVGNNASSNFQINGGSYTGSISWERNGIGSIHISSGTFTVDPTEYVVYSSKVTCENDIWTVSPITGGYEAKIGNTTYGTLADAVDAATDGQTVDLLKNVTTNEQILINDAITLDGHGFTVTAGTWNAASPSDGDAHLVSVSSGSKTVVIRNITLTGAKDIGEDNGSGLNVYESSNVTLNNVTLKDNEAAGLIVNGSTVNATGLHTSGNEWYGVNVAKGSGVTNTPHFTFDTTSTFGEPVAVCGSSDAVVFAPEGWVCMELSGGKIWGKVFAGGTGTAQDPYEIANVEQLKLFRDSVNLGMSYQGKYIQLTANVDLNNEAWTPIGAKGKPFQGTFDGNNKTIFNLSINDSNLVNAGLFGVLNTPGTIKNLTVTNAKVTAKSSAGALIGSAYTGALEKCNITGTVNITANYKVGGLAGEGYADITDCSVIVDEDSKVTGNYTDTETNLEGDNVGGLVGFLGEGDTTVSGCTVSGLTVSGTRKVGGLVGSVFTSNHIDGCTVSNVTVTSNATEGYVTGNSSSIAIGGLAGVYTTEKGGPCDGTLTNCTVENITLTGPEGVHKGYLVGGMRGKLPNFPVSPWYQTGNKLQGANSGSNSVVDNTVIDGVYPIIVSTPEELTATLDCGGTVQLGADIAVAEELIFIDNTVLDMNGKTLTINGGKSAVKVASGKTLTVKGSGTVNGALYADKNSTLTVTTAANFTVNSKNLDGRAVYGAMGSTVNISGGTYIASYEGSVIDTASAKMLSMKDTIVTVDSASVIDSIGITGNASKVYLENVTVNAQYSRAVYLNNQYGSSIIKGGTFITDKVSPDWNPNPTIQYAGTLDISNASITRVGTGILYKVNWPKPTEVEGLTHNNVTFNTVDSTVNGYQDINFG